MAINNLGSIDNLATTKKLENRLNQMQKKDSHVRSIAKSISWRILGTIDTVIISFFIIGEPIKALTIGGIEIITKISLFYLHERLWLKIPEDFRFFFSRREDNKID